jgi:hypothetical protein
VIASGGVEDLAKQGKVVADTRVAIARTALGIAVPKGAPKPDATSVCCAVASPCGRPQLSGRLHDNLAIA